MAIVSTIVTPGRTGASFFLSCVITPVKPLTTSANAQTDDIRFFSIFFIVVSPAENRPPSHTKDHEDEINPQCLFVCLCGCGLHQRRNRMARDIQSSPRSNSALNGVSARSALTGTT